MSLVVCSNSKQDGSVAGNESSISEPWSFRNTLSSTYKIPKDSQVALQSCKVNIGGRVAFGGNSRFYQYLGQKLDTDPDTSPQLTDVTSAPVLVQLDSGNEQLVNELSQEEFANFIEDKLNDTMYHPNLKGKIDVSVLQNASNLDFLGYKITTEQVNSQANNIPTDDFSLWGEGDGGVFTYGAGVFQRADLDPENLCQGINIQKPLSVNASFVVNISGTNADVNVSGTQVEFIVGLSRHAGYNVNDYNEGYSPTYYDGESSVFAPFTDTIPFMDFGCGRDSSGNLTCFHAVAKGTDGSEIQMEEVEYWNNASSNYSSKKNISGYKNIRYTIVGEQVKLEIETDKSVWEVVTEYLSTASKTDMFKPVNQACWCLHPVLYIQGTDLYKTKKMEITHYGGIDITDYDPLVAFKGGWYETMEIFGNESQCLELESRNFNTTSGTAYAQLGLNASGGVAYDSVFILEESKEIYKGTPGANAMKLLGFNTGLVDTPFALTEGLGQIFQSDTIPSLVSSMSLFVKLNNLGQNVVNAYQGNNSKILSHLVDLETLTGRQTYEPNNLVWLDLDNPADMNITEFDLSFTYVNEQFARILTGQSIVCLYFRDKPK